MNRHEGRYKCQATPCQKLQAFPTLSDLNRHRKSVHGEGTLLFCKVSTCKHVKGGAKKGFARLDNWREHMRREHPSLDMESNPLKLVEAEQGDVRMAEYQDNSVKPFQSLPASAASNDGSAAFSTVADNARTATKVLVAKPFSLKEENACLQERVRKLESENDMLWKLIDSLRRN